MPSRLRLFTKEALLRLLERQGISVVLIQAGSDYVRTGTAVNGVKDRLTRWLTRRVPEGISQNTSMVLTVRRNV
jgi:hypothetical protein